MKKKLFFVFSVFNNCLYNRAIQMHIKCIEHYKDIFDSAFFVLNCEEGTTDETINEIRDIIINFGFNDLRYKIRKANAFYESEPVYEEIVCNAHKSDELVFVSHTKGVSNYKFFDVEQIDNWITGLYFLSLSDIKKVEYDLIKFEPLFYGSFLLCKDIKNTVYPCRNYMYEGNFFWMNPKKFSDYITRFSYRIEKPTDRWFMELFPGNFINDRILVSSYKYYILKNCDLYHNSIGAIKEILKDDFDKFNEFKNNIVNKLK